MLPDFRLETHFSRKPEHTRFCHRQDVWRSIGLTGSNNEQQTWSVTMKSSIKPAIVGATLLDSLPIHAAMFEVQFTGSVSHVEVQSNF